jgi:hypothetical protein
MTTTNNAPAEGIALEALRAFYLHGIGIDAVDICDGSSLSRERAQIALDALVSKGLARLHPCHDGVSRYVLRPYPLRP